MVVCVCVWGGGYTKLCRPNLGLTTYTFLLILSSPLPTDFYRRNMESGKISELEAVFTMSAVKSYTVTQVHLAFVEMFEAKGKYILDMVDGNNSLMMNPIRGNNDTQVFDITSLFHVWRQATDRSSENFAFVFNISYSGRSQTGRFLHNRKRNQFVKETRLMKASPLFVVVFYDDAAENSFEHPPHLLLSQHAPRSKLRSSTNQLPLCKMYDLTVNLKQLGYTKIIQPKNVNIRYCFGRCSDSPGNNHAVLHAIFLWHVRQKGNTTVSSHKLEPCCAPAKLTGLVIMTRENDGSIVQKNVQNAVVSSCKCR